MLEPMLVLAAATVVVETTTVLVGIVVVLDAPTVARVELAAAASVVEAKAGVLRAADEVVDAMPGPVESDETPVD